MAVDPRWVRPVAKAGMALSRILPLRLAERVFLVRQRLSGCKWRPVFIIGAPRSGTTILYQLLLTHYRFVYLCNLDSFWYRAPALSDRLMTARGKRHFSDKGRQSRYGYIPGLFSPSEAGPVHARWFGETRSNSDASEVVAAMSEREGAPFLAKNTVDSLRIPEILERLPQVQFIWMQREPAPLESSLLRWREDSGGSWVGARPPGFEGMLQRSPEEQVRWQRETIEAEIFHQANENPDRFWPVAYERLCERPAEVLETLAAAYARATGLALAPTGVPMPKDGLRPSGSKAVS